MRYPLFIALILVAATRLGAQAPASLPPRPYGFALAAGTALVSGEDRDYYQPGYQLQGSVDVPLPARFGLSLRADLMYARVPGRDRSTQRYPGGPDTLLIGDLSMLSGTVSAVYHVRRGARAAGPYLIAGPGIFRVEQKGVLYGQPVTGAQTRFGISGGAGVAFPLGPLGAFVEARIHDVFVEGGSARLYPIVLGVTF